MDNDGPLCLGFCLTFFGLVLKIPSDDPKLEVIVILSIFKLASQCSEFIHTHSSFGRMIKGAMSLKNNNFRVVNLDETGRRYSKNHSLSVNVSQSYT